VKLGVVDADKGKVRWISLTNDEEPTFRALAGSAMEWSGAEVLNRNQDKMDLYFVDAKSGKSTKVLAETSPGAWINVNDDFQVLKSGDRFLWSSWRDGTPICIFTALTNKTPLAAEAKLERQLTQGDFEVMGVEGVDEAAGTIFFSSNKDDPRQRHIFSIKLDGNRLANSLPPTREFTPVSSPRMASTTSRRLGPSTAPRMSLCTVEAHAAPCGRRAMKSRNMELRRRSSWVQSGGWDHAVWTPAASSGRAAQRQDSADREYLWRSCRADRAERSDEPI